MASYGIGTERTMIRGITLRSRPGGGVAELCSRVRILILFYTPVGRQRQCWKVGKLR
jgi:hypothetical protein